MGNRIKAVTDKIDNLPEAQRPKVFYMTWHDPLKTAGGDTWYEELITKAGGINIAHDLSDLALGELPCVTYPELFKSSAGMDRGG